MNTYSATAFIALSGLMSGSVASAATPPTSSVSPLSPIYACAEQTDPTMRLACFDSAVATIKAAEARSDIVTLDRPRVAAVRREAFGFRIPSLPRFGFGGPAVAGTLGAPASTASTSASSAPAQARDESEEEQTFVVAQVGNSGGRTAIYLENGNIWHLTETGELNAPGRTPFNVRIRSAALGSYMLTVEGRNKGYRVRRVQ